MITRYQGRLLVAVMCFPLVVSTPSAFASVLQTTTVPIEAAARTLDTIVVSPDGLHIYANPWWYEESLVTYGWNETDQEFEFLRQGSGWGGEWMLMSFDGRDLYSSGLPSVDSAYLHRSSRDPVTGELTQQERFSNDDRVEGLNWSIDGNQIYVGGRQTFSIYDRDPATGVLTLAQRFEDGIGGVSGLDFVREFLPTPDGSQVYVWARDSTTLTFDRDPANGLLTYVATSFGPTSRAHDSVITSNGEFVYVVNPGTFGGNTLQVLSRDPSTGDLAVIQTEQLGQPWDVLLSPDEDFIYVGDTGPNEMVVYARDPVTGLISLVGRTFIGQIRDVVMSPTGDYVFTASEAAVALARDADSGSLAIVDVHAGSPDVRAASFTSDGKFLYAADSNVVTVFERDPATDELHNVSGVRNGILGAQLGSPTGMTLTADESQLLVSDTGGVSVYVRDPTSGDLSFADAQSYVSLPGLFGARDPTLSPNQAHVYLVGAFADAVVVLARDAVTGQLTHVETNFEGIDATGMGQPVDVAVSPDGDHVYVTAQAEDAIVHFDRDPTSGALAFVQTYSEASNGVQLLENPGSLRVSPDGTRLYVVAGGAVMFFRREASTGALEFVESQGSGNGLVHLSPNGALAYATGASLSVFRVREDGRISWIDSTPSNYLLEFLPDGRAYTFGTDEPQVHEMAFSCAADPISPCGQALKSKLLLRDRSPDRKDALRWTWAKGDAVPPEDFDPEPNNHFALCFYDESGPAPALVHEALAPSNNHDCATASQSFFKPCWSGTTKVKYRDPFGSPDGLQSINLTPRPVPQSKIQVKGTGTTLTLPALPMSLPLRVQLQTSAGKCWESLFSAAKKNEPDLFKGSAP